MSDYIPTDTYSRVSVKEVGILFASCAAVLVVLVIFRTAINVIVIDVCILGDCSAWKKLCCCFRRRRNRGNDGEGGGGGDGDGDGGISDNNDTSNGSNDGNGFMDEHGRWIPLRIAGAVVNPVSYVYNCPSEQRKAFLDSIIDSELLDPHIVGRNCKQKQQRITNDDDHEFIGDVEEFNHPHNTKNDNHVDDNSNTDGSNATENILEEAALCAICLQNQEFGESCSKAKACSHTFHTECIRSWIDRSLLCPVVGNK